MLENEQNARQMQIKDENTKMVNEGKMGFKGVFDSINEFQKLRRHW